MKKQILPAILAASLTSFFNAPTFADDDLGKIEVCAAVYPCDVDGNVLPEFATGNCATVYAEQCSLAVQQSTTSVTIQKQIVQCRLAKRNLKSNMARRDRTIASLKGKIAQLRNQIALLGR